MLKTQNEYKTNLDFVCILMNVSVVSLFTWEAKLTLKATVSLFKQYFSKCTNQGIVAKKKIKYILMTMMTMMTLQIVYIANHKKLLNKLQIKTYYI